MTIASAPEVRGAEKTAYVLVPLMVYWERSETVAQRVGLPRTPVLVSNL